VLPTALYVHRSALELLDPLVRVYEGCARAYLGEIDGANLIKLRALSECVTFSINVLLSLEFKTGTPEM
jgi:hypothetical protein